MKIGILTFHRTDNYGAMLQAYALSYYLSNLGHAVYFIDYCPEYVYKKLFIKKDFSDKIKGYIKKIVCNNLRKTKQKKFSRFIDLYIPTIPPSEVSHLDIVIIGSDQVWATHLTGDDTYYLGKGIDCKKIVSYAVSCGNVSNIDLKTSLLYKDCLRKLDCISVREQSAKVILDKLLERKCQQTLDPTLLVDNIAFRTIQKKPEIKNYVLVYDGTNPEILKFAGKIAAQMGKSIVAISCDIAMKNRSKLIQDASVEKFLGYIANADLIISTSFHGCALSLSYQKDFYCINTGGIASRSAELLDLFGLSERFIDLHTDISVTHVDYEKVIEKWNILRNESEEFLSNCIK